MTKDDAFGVIARLLEQEHKVIAYKLGLITEVPPPIPPELIRKAIAVADRLSRRNGERECPKNCVNAPG